MTCFEWVTSVISFLSLCATIFFGYQVFKLSKQANDIAKESLEIQKQEIDSAITQVKEIYSSDNINKIEQFKEIKSDINKSSPYHNALNKIKMENK